MSRLKVPLIAYAGRECALECAEFSIFAQGFAYRFALQPAEIGSLNYSAKGGIVTSRHMQVKHREDINAPSWGETSPSFYH